MEQIESNPGAGRRVLVIFPGALGDLICVVPALRAIGHTNPGCAIELMARAELARFARGRMGVARGYSIDRREVSELFVDNPSNLATTKAFFSGFERIYSFFAENNREFRQAIGEVANGPVDFIPFRPPGPGHVADCYLDAVLAADEHADVPSTNREELSRIDVLEEDLAAASETLGKYRLAQSEFVLIFPGSGSPKKNWPAENFAALARQIERWTRAVLVIGPAEAAMEPIFAGEFVTLDERELGEVAGMARLAAGFVGNDSGVSHLAAAAGAIGVVLFGPTDPERWRPWGRVEVLRREPLASLPVSEVAERLADLCQSASGMVTISVEGRTNARALFDWKKDRS